MSVSKMIDDIEMQIKILYVDSESRKLLLGMTSDIKPHVQKLEAENDELKKQITESVKPKRLSEKYEQPIPNNPTGSKYIAFPYDEIKSLIEKGGNV